MLVACEDKLVDFWYCTLNFGTDPIPMTPTGKQNHNQIESKFEIKC